MTSAKVVLDSVSPTGVRLTTMEVCMHRFVLSEFNTHRVFSRNSASSRAIPLEKQLAQVVLDPALPLELPCEQAGMQGGSALKGKEMDEAMALINDIWSHTTRAMEDYVKHHPDKSTRLHKSVVNRYLEPFMWHTVIVTSSEWDNFFGLRANPMAQPEIRVAAEAMLEAYNNSEPNLVNYDDWHTPYIQPDEDLHGQTRRKVSAARCARVSYLTHDGVRDIDKDIVLYDRLTVASPPHASPLEHVATPAFPNSTVLGNFRGWHQLRHMEGM